MDLSELSRYRDILERKRDELLASTPLRQPTTEPGSKSGDWIDQSSQESDLHVHLALKQTDTKVLRAIEEAIHRMDQGVYGICMSISKDCDHPILILPVLSVTSAANLSKTGAST